MHIYNIYFFTYFFNFFHFCHFHVSFKRKKKRLGIFIIDTKFKSKTRT